MGIYDRDYQRDDYQGQSYDGSYGGSSQWSMVTWIIVINIGVFLLQVFSEDAATYWLALKEDWFTRPWEIYTFLSYGFAHSYGNWMHIASNMIGVYFFGRVIEMTSGGREMLAYYLSAILFAGLAWFVVEIATPTPPGYLPSVIGASGGVVALVILFALRFPRQKVYLMGIIEMPAWVLGLFIVGYDAFRALTNTQDKVAVTAHLGGALFAYLYFRYHWRLAPYLPTAWNIQQWKAAMFRPRLKVHAPPADDTPNKLDRDLDRILQKIKDEGQESLTAKERQTLEQASRKYQQQQR